MFQEEDVGFTGVRHGDAVGSVEDVKAGGAVGAGLGGCVTPPLVEDEVSVDAAVGA